MIDFSILGSKTVGDVCVYFKSADTVFTFKNVSSRTACIPFKLTKKYFIDGKCEIQIFDENYFLL